MGREGVADVCLSGTELQTRRWYRRYQLSPVPYPYLVETPSDRLRDWKDCTRPINFNQSLLGLSGWLGYHSVTIC